MSKPEITYELAMATARDAGNRSMRAGGRTKWAVKDWNEACKTFERLWPTPTTDDNEQSKLKTCCTYTVAVQDNPIFTDKRLHCDSCGRALRYAGADWKYESFEGLCNSAKCEAEHCKSLAPRAGERDALDDQEFYELMQAYRHAGIADQDQAVAAFEAVKAYVRNQHTTLVEQRRFLEDRIAAQTEMMAKVVERRNNLLEQREQLMGAIRDVAIRSLLYCEQKYGHDDQARLNLEALLNTIEQSVKNAATIEPEEKETR